MMNNSQYLQEILAGWMGIIIKGKFGPGRAAARITLIDRKYKKKERKSYGKQWWINARELICFEQPLVVSSNSEFWCSKGLISQSQILLPNNHLESLKKI